MKPINMAVETGIPKRPDSYKAKKTQIKYLVEQQNI